MKGLAVYTALFGDYDTISPVEIIDPLVDYICFTDKSFDAPPPWQVRVVERPHPDPRYASRYFFDQSTLVLPEYKCTIMHGANARLTTTPYPLLSYLDKNDIAAFKHPHRSNVYSEFLACLQLGKDTWEKMQPQMMRYQAEGFPGDGLSACILLVRHNTLELQAFERMWWEEVNIGSHRDQLSFDYCRWKLGMEVSTIPGDPFSSPYFKVSAHAN